MHNEWRTETTREKRLEQRNGYGRKNEKKMLNELKNVLSLSKLNEIAGELKLGEKFSPKIKWNCFL